MPNLYPKMFLYSIKKEDIAQYIFCLWSSEMKGFCQNVIKNNINSNKKNNLANLKFKI